MLFVLDTLKKGAERGGGGVRDPSRKIHVFASDGQLLIYHNSQS